MRAHTNEHRDLLPTIDIAVLKHTAYVFDAVMFYLRTQATLAPTRSTAVPASRTALSKSTSNILLDTYKSIKKKLNRVENSDESSSSESECELDKVETYKVNAGSDLDNFDEDYEDDEDDASSQSEDETKKVRKNKGDEYDEIYDSESSSIKLGRLKRADHDEDFSSMVESSDDDEDQAGKSGKKSQAEKKQSEEGHEASNNKPVRYQLRRPCTRKATFFKRSDSTLCLGGRAPDPFTSSLDESLPLVTRPHLLQPHARIQDMFRVSSDQSSQFRSLRRIGLMSSELRFNYPKLDAMKHSASDFSLNKPSESSSEQVSAKRPFKKTKSGTSRKLTRFERSMSKLLIPTSSKHQRKRNSTSSGDPVESVIFNPDELIDRWRLTIDLFGRVFCDDVGLEPASLIRQLGGFQLKEAKFRREMERLRNLATRELSIDVDREREKLMQATFKSLNNMYYLQYNRRMASAQVVNSSSSAISKSSVQLVSPPLLCLSRVKITFRDEQGEGSGVARSFYTAFAEAVLADADMPSLADALNPSHASSPTSTGGGLASHQQYVPFTMHRYRSSPTTRSAIYTSGSGLQESASGRRITATASSMPNPTPNTATPPTSLSPPNTSNIVIRSSYSTRSSSSLTSPRSDPLILHPSSISRATANYSSSSGSNSLLDQYHQLLSVEPFPSTSSRVQASPSGANSSTGATSAPTSSTATAPPASSPPPDTAPLFWQPDKQRGSSSSGGGGGFYSPRAGKLSQQRLNAHRNIGRIIGICLLQNELCPIQLSRHVIKYILGRSVRWHDLAFYDPQMYESLRKMVLDAEKMLVKLLTQDEKKMTMREAIRECNEMLFKPLELTFNIDLPNEEDGGNHDLVENGKHIPVTCVNMYEFVKRYAEYRMVKRVEPCLQQLRQGVIDVLPASALDNITAEEFRLLLNGVADVNIHTLASYTTISDESKESGRRPQFEKWFWSTLDKMNQQEKQELLFFW